MSTCFQHNSAPKTKAPAGWSRWFRLTIWRILLESSSDRTTKSSLQMGDSLDQKNSAFCGAWINHPHVLFGRKLPVDNPALVCLVVPNSDT